ncbi:MAG: hypothetical protein M0R38_12330 [Bacteroidia bacterium]|nr:hypothetical protein [Bacteroidia bacterium]
MNDEKSKMVNFAKSIKEMISVSGDAYNANSMKRVNVSTETTEDIISIIEAGNADQIIALSEKYVATSGLYQRILVYFSTFLTNDVFITPKKITSKSLNQKKYLENYRKATFFADTVLDPKLNFPRITFKLLVYGAYYGILVEESETEMVLKDLPTKFCRSRFKTHQNVNVLEFDVSYFDTITDKVLRENALKEYPKEFKKAHNAYKKDVKLKWFTVSPEIGVAFYYQDQYKPFFISMIPTVADLREYRALEKSLDKQELEEILVQEIPVDKEGNFILSSDEATELHRGVVNMLKNNPYTDVITTFAKLNLLKVSDKTKSARDNLEKTERSVYTEAGVSKLLFAGDSATAVKMSITNDMALILDIEEQYVSWLTYQTNLKYAEKNKYYFEVSLLPISHYNRNEMLDIYLKAAQYGYSKILVSIAAGLKQSSFLDLIEFENEILKLHDIMIPLQSSHTSSGDDGDNGRPKKEIDEKEEKTIDNEEGM